MAGESKDVTMVVLAQLREDVAEFERLLLQATRRKAKDVLSLEIRKLQTEIVTRQESLEKLDKLATDAQPKPPTNNVSAAPRRYTKELTTYGRPNTSYVHVGRNLWICAIHGSRCAIYGCIPGTLRRNPWIAQESVDRAGRSMNFAYV